MKSFDIITEADARTLEIGSSVTLKPGGHVTPLAADTLKARRITVLSGVAEASLDGLAPVADIKSIAIGSDHSGVALKASAARPPAAARPQRARCRHRRRRSGRLSRHRRAGRAPRGAQGSRRGDRDRRRRPRLGIAANKIDGARAAMCTDKTLARYSREHNGANVLALGATLVSVDDAKAIVDTWIATPMGEARYIRRLAKIRALERMQ